MKLYELFYNFHFSKNKNGISAKQFADHMVNCFAPSNVVVIGKNLDDGIGDCVSQFYITKKLMQLLNGLPDVDVKVISYVSEKKDKLAEKIAQETFGKDQIFTLSSNDAMYSSQPIILGMPRKKEQEDFLSNIMRNADFVFNVAIGLHSDLNRAPRIAIPAKDNTFLNSWVQYEYHSHSYPKLNNSYLENYIEYKDANAIYTENAMGIHQNQMGLRFIDSIEESITKSRQALLETLKAESIINKHIPLDKEEQSFAAGYLQSEDCTLAFVLMAAQTTPNENGDMNAFINTDFYEEKDTDLNCQNKSERNARFHKTLREFGYTHVEMITDSNQEPKITILNADTHKKRTLRLVRFAGISEKSKAALEALSEIVSGSGDTSVSEVITAGLKQNQTALPFFQHYITSPSSSCIQSILEEVDAWREENTHQELYDYLNYLFQNSSRIRRDSFLGNAASINFTYDPNRSDELGIKNSREEIVASWNKFCLFLFENRNETSHFNELMVTYTFHRLLVNNQLELFKELSASLGKNAFKNETLLHLAVKLNCTSIAQYLVENDFCDINKTHCYNGYTALHMAVHQGNEDLTKLLVSAPSINLHAIDRGGNTPFLLSAIAGNIAIFNLLYTATKPLEKDIKAAFILAAKNGHKLIVQYLKNSAGMDINDPEIKIVLNKALKESITNEDTELAARLISIGADVNYQETPGCSLLVIAVKTYLSGSSHRMAMINLLLENNADPNADAGDRFGNVLWRAAFNKDMPLFEFLLNRGAKIEKLLDLGITHKNLLSLFGIENREKLLSIIENINTKYDSLFTSLQSLQKSLQDKVSTAQSVEDLNEKIQETITLLREYFRYAWKLSLRTAHLGEVTDLLKELLENDPDRIADISLHFEEKVTGPVRDFHYHQVLHPKAPPTAAEAQRKLAEDLVESLTFHERSALLNPEEYAKEKYAEIREGFSDKYTLAHGYLHKPVEGSDIPANILQDVLMKKEKEFSIVDLPPTALPTPSQVSTSKLFSNKPAASKEVVNPEAGFNPTPGK